MCRRMNKIENVSKYIFLLKAVFESKLWEGREWNGIGNELRIIMNFWKKNKSSFVLSKLIATQSVHLVLDSHHQHVVNPWPDCVTHSPLFLFLSLSRSQSPAVEQGSVTESTSKIYWVDITWIQSDLELNEPGNQSETQMRNWLVTFDWFTNR